VAIDGCTGLPVAGAERALKVLDPGLPGNTFLHREWRTIESKFL